MQRATFLILLASLLTACHGAQAPRPGIVTDTPKVNGQPGTASLASTRLPSRTSSPLPGSWQLVAIHNVDQNVMAAGFLTENYGITAGTAPGLMFTTTDGGRHWYEGTNQSDCRYGIDIVDTRVGWTSGGAMNVRRSTDSGANWLPVTDYGLGTTKPFHTISFLDDTTGWIASLYMFGSTRDGGNTWSNIPLPAGLNDISSILLVAPDTGFLLDFSGVLFHTLDNGLHWTVAGKLDLGRLVIPKATYQMAAMRFSDRDHGLIVISEAYQKGKVKAFHTSDGGLTWSSELVPVISGPVFLSRREPLLTVLDGADSITVMRYAGP
jgi:photosystem II stability/assembly factor-like uncharacterized protein